VLVVGRLRGEREPREGRRRRPAGGLQEAPAGGDAGDAGHEHRLSCHGRLDTRPHSRSLTRDIASFVRLWLWGTLLCCRAASSYEIAWHGSGERTCGVARIGCAKGSPEATSHRIRPMAGVHGGSELIRFLRSISAAS
jgi:hypothetical protein